MQHRTLSWMRGIVAACGLALAIVVGGATHLGGARADEKEAPAPAPSVLGVWDYVEDRTPPENNRDPRERPPVGPSFKVSLEDKTYVLERTRRGVRFITRVLPDGAEDVKPEGTGKRVASGRMEGGVLTVAEAITSESNGQTSTTTVTYTMTPEKDGLFVKMQITGPSLIERMAFYRRGIDVPAPTPAKADLAALAWLEGRFTMKGTGEGGKATEMEEHWGPAGGGAMLGTARTVSGGKMTSFEFLRIVEREGGLVYIAQPGGGSPTEFVLTEISETRALFENPKNEYPKRIVYERLPAPKDGVDGLRTEISDKGGARPYGVSYTRSR
jgi:hypothetical protein